MQVTPTITFRGVRRTTRLETHILTHVRRLEKYYPRASGCRVLVEAAQRPHQAGNRYHVRIDLSVPGREIVVAHQASQHATAQQVHARRLTKATESDPALKHVRVAIRKAFDAARRRLQDYARRRRRPARVSARSIRGASHDLPVAGSPQSGSCGGVPPD